MSMSDSIQLNLDGEARVGALRFAANVMHFIRTRTLTWNYIDHTESWLQLQPVTYHGHTGKPPRVIDLLAQRRFEDVVAHQRPSPLLGRVIVLGEEASLPDWDPNEPGRVSIFRCDPVDGTSALAHSGDGYSTVVTVESRRDSGHAWKHFGGAIVRSDGLAISWSRRSVLAHHIVLDAREEARAEYDPPRLDLGALPQLTSRDMDETHRAKVIRSGAVVAAQSSARRKALLKKYPSLIQEAEFMDFKAGTPIAWPLCTGLLGWVIELNATTIHDAVHLLPFTALGGKVVDAQLHPINVLGQIEHHAGPEALEKVFPPYIAYVSDESLDFVTQHAAQ